MGISDGEAVLITRAVGYLTGDTSGFIIHEDGSLETVQTYADDGKPLPGRGALPSRQEIEEKVAELQQEAARQAIKDECKRRIYDRYSSEQQLNFNAAGIRLAHIKHERPLSESERKQEQGIEEVFNWIDAMRARSNALELNPPADPEADVHWPPY